MSLHVSLYMVAMAVLALTQPWVVRSECCTDNSLQSAPFCELYSDLTVEEKKVIHDLYGPECNISEGT